jgi:hypothetical protein
MWAPGVRILSWGERVRVRALRAAGVAALAVAFGCADRIPATALEAPPVSAAPARIAARVVPPPVIGAPALLRPRAPLPPPVAMPGGGIRIDLRGSGKHIRALERQPDGSFKHACVDAPELAPSGSAP